MAHNTNIYVGGDVLINRHVLVGGNIIGRNDVLVDGNVRIATGGGFVPVYDGQYVVIPKVYRDQILPTNSKMMIDDVTVKEITLAITENEKGGYTAQIGEI